MRTFLIRSALSAVALAVAAWIVSGIHFDFGSVTSWWGKAGIVFLVAMVFGVVNAFIKPIVQILSIPLYILTLGLIHIVINALMLELTAWITRNITHWGLYVDSFFWSAIWGAIVISLVGWLTAMLLPDRVENLYQ